MINKSLIYSTIFLLLGFCSSLLMEDAIETWYVNLNKPPLTPPNWIFAPVWSFLYITMGISIAYILSSESKYKKTAIILFYIHLVLNLIWSYLFFGLKSTLFGLIGIISLDLLVVFMMLTFYHVNKKAFFILIPYILWLDFATYLNLAIYLIN